MDVLLVCAGVAVGAVLTKLGQALWRRLRPGPACDWCAEASGWHVPGHNTLDCRAYYRQMRERCPAFGGNAWRDPGDHAFEADLSRAAWQPYSVRPGDPSSNFQ